MCMHVYICMNSHYLTSLHTYVCMYVYAVCVNVMYVCMDICTVFTVYIPVANVTSAVFE